MLQITLAQLKSDITPKLKGTSLRQINDFYGVAQTAANRMLSRIDPTETRRTATLLTSFYDNLQDYPIPVDYKGMIDIYPQANRKSQPGDSDYGQTSPKQFNMKMAADSFSIRWNNGVRTMRAQRLPAGNVTTMDTFDSPTENGTWTAEGDANGLYIEPLNYISGNGALGMNLSGATGLGDIVNSTAAVTDLSLLRYNDASMIYAYIPLGTSSRFTNFKLRRGSSSSNYVEATVTTKADGTAFTDGWNFLLFQWNTATVVGSPDDTKNTYRRFGITYSAGAAINGFLLNAWTDSLGTLYNIDYYSEYMFRSAAGVWQPAPLVDTDLVNVDSASYEILKTEMMVDITQIIRTGNVRVVELADWRLMLNGQPQSRYVKDPPYHGLYADYLQKFPSSQIPTVTLTYEFDV